MFEAVVGELQRCKDDMFGDSVEYARFRIQGRTTDELVRILRGGEEHVDERSFYYRVMSTDTCFVAWEELLRNCSGELEALTLVDPSLGINRATDQSFLSTKAQIIGHVVEQKDSVFGSRPCELGDLTLFSAVLGGGWIDPQDQTRAHIFSRRAPTGELAVQLQVKCKDYLKCVHLILKQVGRDLVARADWAAYTTVDHTLGYDFELACDKYVVPVATSAAADGYGVSGLYLYYTTHWHC